MPWSQNRLDSQHQTIPPVTEVTAVLRIQRLGAIAEEQVAPHVPVAIGSPLGVGGRQIGDPQSDAHAVEHIVELALFAPGLAVYLRDTRARDRVGSWGLWAMVVLLAGFFIGGTFGGAPPSERSLAVMTLGLWLFVPWAWWVDGHRDRVNG